MMKEREELEKIATDIKNQQEGGIYGVSDGVVNYAEYDKSPIKILWVLCEPYRDDGGWSITEAFNKYKNWSEIKASYKFHRQIISTTYGILNKLNSGKIPLYKEDNVFAVLKRIAYINLKKIPGAQARMKHKKIKDSTSNNIHLIKRQMELCNPNIIIFGGSFKFIKEHLNIPSEMNTLGHAHSFTINSTLYIDAYHPSNTTINERAYQDDIINTYLNSIS